MQGLWFDVPNAERTKRFCEIPNGLAAERGGKDAVRGYVSFLYKVPDAVGHHRRLPGAGHGPHHRRASPVPDDGPLFVGEGERRRHSNEREETRPIR